MCFSFGIIEIAQGYSDFLDILYVKKAAKECFIAEEQNKWTKIIQKLNPSFKTVWT
jgi:hypothetical protein